MHLHLCAVHLVEVTSADSRIRARAVETRTMPPGNATFITEEERALLARWLAATEIPSAADARQIDAMFVGNTARSAWMNIEMDSGAIDVLALMNMSAAQLRTKFGEFQDVREETLWGGVWTQHFRAIPSGSASYKYIEVWVDKDGMPVQTKMVEKNDDSTTVRLTNVERNPSIPMDQFKLNLGSGVKIIKG